MRSVMALAILSFSVFIANRVGIMDLIAHGYGSLTWGVLLAFVLPVMTIGLWKAFIGGRITQTAPRDCAAGQNE